MTKLVSNCIGLSLWVLGISLVLTAFGVNVFEVVAVLLLLAGMYVALGVPAVIWFYLKKWGVV